MSLPIQILRAVNRIFIRAPWLTEIGLERATFVADDKLKSQGHPTMATDGRRVFYHPEVLTQWSPEALMGVIVHEWLHGANRHAERMRRIKQAQHLTWNIAADAVINPMVKAFGFELPKGGVDINGFDAIDVEEAYRRLLQQPPPSGGGGSGKGKPELGKAMANGQDLVISDGPPPSEAEEKQAEAQAMGQIARMVSAAKAAGKCPAGLEQLIDQWTKPKVNWREALRAWATRISRDSWSYARNHGSYRAMGLYVPGRRSLTIGDIVIVRDTSGSLVNRQNEIASETMSVLRDAQPERIWLIDADARVHRALELRPNDELPRDAIGGGGTDFCPAFDWLEQHQVRPAVMVYITDLCGTFPDKAPDYPVLWALIGSGSLNPPFGEEVVIDIE